MALEGCHANDDEPLVLIVLVPFLQTRKSDAARAAPGCPEIKQHHASAQIRNFRRLLIDPLVRHNLRRSGHRCMRVAKRFEEIDVRIDLEQPAQGQFVQISGWQAQRQGVHFLHRGDGIVLFLQLQFGLRKQHNRVIQDCVALEEPLLLRSFFGRAPHLLRMR